MNNEAPKSDTPATGLTEIDGKAATSVSWSRNVEGEKVSYTLIFRSGTKQLTRLKDLSADQVSAALGDANARNTHYSTDAKGLLKGKHLQYAQGISPELASQYKDNAENAAAQVYSNTPQSEPVAGETNVDFRDDTQNERAKEILARQSGNDLREDAGEETTGSAPKERETVEKEGQNQVDQDAEHVGEPPLDEEREAREASRKALQSELDSAFYHVDNKYYRRDNENKLAILEGGAKLRTAESDPYVAVSMVKLAEAKGWESIKVTGTPEFRQAVWMEAALRGVQVRGYKPTEVDLLKLAEKQEARLSNSVEQVDVPNKAKATPEENKGNDQSKDQVEPKDQAEPKREAKHAGTVGVVLSHGAAKFNFDKDESPNYYVRLQTAAGEKVIWGVDLENAMEAGKIQTGERVELVNMGRQPMQVMANVRDDKGEIIGKELITSHRNAWLATRMVNERAEASVKTPADAAQVGQAEQGKAKAATASPPPIAKDQGAISTQSSTATPAATDKETARQSAQAFRSNQQPERWTAAAAKHPQLTAAYAQLSVLKRYAEESLPEKQREAFVSRQVHNIAKELESGRPLGAIQIATQVDKKSQQKETSAER